MFEVPSDNFQHFHGVFMEIFGKGVLLKGESGIGKSEIALTLMDRGSLLISDDSVVFTVSDNRVIGTCPESLRDLLEIRGLGILNMRHLLGDHILKDHAFLDLIIHFAPDASKKPEIIHPVEPVYSQETILNQTIPEITLSLLPGRNTALVVETAVRYHQHTHKHHAC